MSSPEQLLADKAVAMVERYVAKCDVLENRVIVAEALAIVSLQKQRETEEKLYEALEEIERLRREAHEEIERLRREVHVAYLHSDLYNGPQRHPPFQEDDS